MPATVRAAAVAFALYAMLVIVHATVWQSLGGWSDAGEYSRAVVRFLGTLATAWGLWRGHRWAWWLAVGLGSFFVAAWVVALVLVSRLSGDSPSFPTPAAAPAVAAALVATAVVLLLLPASRAAFRADAA